MTTKTAEALALAKEAALADELLELWRTYTAAGEADGEAADHAEATMVERHGENWDGWDGRGWPWGGEEE